MTEYYDEYEDDYEDEEDVLYLGDAEWDLVAQMAERVDRENAENAEIDEVVSQIQSLQNQIGRPLTNREINSLAAQIEATGSTNVGEIWDYMGGDRAAGTNDDARVELMAEIMDSEGGTSDAPPAYWDAGAQEQ